MNRPAVLRRIDTHVARRSVTAFRLRAADAERLMDYVEHLERRAQLVTTGAVTINHVAVERRLGDVVRPYVLPMPPVAIDCLDAMGGRVAEPCASCGTVGGHTMACDYARGA